MNSQIVAAIALFAALALGYYIRRMVEQVQSLQKKIDELSAIVNRRKLPYPAQAGLEDAIAIAIEVLQQHHAWRAYDETRVNQLADILRQIRSNPQGYDTNQPDLPPAANDQR